jgi:hypothetical protein
MIFLFAHPTRQPKAGRLCGGNQGGLIRDRAFFEWIEERAMNFPV